MTATENGYFYVGRHSTNNVNDQYKGSGKLILLCNQKGIPLYRKILSFYETFEELIVAEEKLINYYFHYDKNMNLNYSSVGFACGDLNPAKDPKVIAKRITPRSRLKWSKYMSEHNPSKREDVKIMRSDQLKSQWEDPEYRLKHSGENHHMKSEVHKSKMKENNPMYNLDVVDKVRQSVLKTIEAGTHNSFIKETCPYCGKVGSRPNMVRWHFENCKHK